MDCARNGRQHRGNGMVVFFRWCHLPNVTAVEWLKSRWAMIPPMSTRVAKSSLRMMVPSARKSDADDLHHIPLQERMTGRWRMLVASVSRYMARSMSGLSAYFLILAVLALYRSDCLPTIRASITSPSVPIVATISGFLSPSYVR